MEVILRAIIVTGLFATAGVLLTGLPQIRGQ